MLTIENVIESADLFKANIVKYTFLKDGPENKTYKVECGDKTYCVRITQSKQRLYFGLEAKKEAQACQQASAFSIAPTVHSTDHNAEYLITDFFHGRCLTDEDARNSEIMKKYIEAIKLIHNNVKVDRFFSIYDRFYKYIETAKSFERKLPDWLNKVMEQVESIKEMRNDSKIINNVFCHNDIWHGNILYDGNAICIIDWEFCGYGDGFFDLAHISRGDMTFEEEKFMLKIYFGHFEMEMWEMLQQMKYISRVYDALWYAFHSCMADDIDQKNLFMEAATKQREAASQFLNRKPHG